MNNKQMKQFFVRVFKFMLIGIIPNLFLYYFFYGKVKDWLLSFISIILFVACGFIGEVIYTKIKNKQILQEMVDEAEQKKQKKDGEK